MKRHAPAWTYASASCTMTLGRLCLQVVPLMQGACFLDRYRSSEPAEEPIFVASPFVVIAARSAFEAVDPALEQVATTLGKGSWTIFWHVNLPLARAGIIAGVLLGWLRALGEFGATVVLAYHPYTLPVYLYVQLSGTGVNAALPLALLSLGVSCIGGGLVLWIQYASQRREMQ